MKNLAIWGWWQGKNLGDQWIKNTMKQLFPEADFISTTNNPNKYDFVICGGGGLFIKDVPYCWRHIRKKTSFGMLGLGAEFVHSSNEAAKLAKKAKFFYVRDKYSMDCMHIKNMARSYDITFAVPLEILDENINYDKCFFVWRTPSQSQLEDERFYEYQRPKYDYYDYERTIRSNFSEYIYDDFLTYDADLKDRIAGCDFVISGRYHGIIAAVQLGIPCIGIDLCPKIRALMKEIGIEKYCIKLDEVDKLDELIKDAKSNRKSIRTLELQYREIACATIEKHIEEARFEIFKAANPLRIMHYGNYFFGSNDVVSVMADALKNSVSNAKTIEIKKRKYFNTNRIKTELPTPNGTITVLKTIPILVDYLLNRPEVIVLNSGGLTFDKFGWKILEKLKITTVDLELSDPDVFPYNGSIYASKFDLFFTNAMFTIQNQYSKAKLLGFAATPAHHYYMPDVERKFDVVVVGGCRPDRVAVVNELKKSFNVGLYGSGWENSEGVVSGDDLVRAINSGKIYLSFAKTMAGYTNIKVGLFEAIACKSFVITDYMDELKYYFDIGNEVVCYSNIEELKDMIKYYLVHDDERQQIAENAYQRFLNDHTYEKRWNGVLKELYELRGIKNESEY